MPCDACFCGLGSLLVGRVLRSKDVPPGAIAEPQQGVQRVEHVVSPMARRLDEGVAAPCCGNRSSAASEILSAVYQSVVESLETHNPLSKEELSSSSLLQDGVLYVSLSPSLGFVDTPRDSLRAPEISITSPAPEKEAVSAVLSEDAMSSSDPIELHKVQADQQCSSDCISTHMGSSPETPESSRPSSPSPLDQVLVVPKLQICSGVTQVSSRESLLPYPIRDSRRSPRLERSPRDVHQLVKLFLKSGGDPLIMTSAAEELLFETVPRENVRGLNITILNEKSSRQAFLDMRRFERGKVIFTWHLAGSTAAANAIESEGIRCDEEHCSCGRYGRGGYVATSAAKAHSYADSRGYGGERNLFLVLASPEDDLISGQRGTRPERTAADLPSHPTEYCFVDERRLHCVCRLDYQWVPTGRRPKNVTAGGHCSEWRTSSGSPSRCASPRRLCSLEDLGFQRRMGSSEQQSSGFSGIADHQSPSRSCIPAGHRSLQEFASTDRASGSLPELSNPCGSPSPRGQRSFQELGSNYRSITRSGEFVSPRGFPSPRGHRTLRSLDNEHSLVSRNPQPLQAGTCQRGPSVTNSLCEQNMQDISQCLTRPHVPTLSFSKFTCQEFQSTSPSSARRSRPPLHPSEENFVRMGAVGEEIIDRSPSPVMSRQGSQEKLVTLHAPEKESSPRVSDVSFLQRSLVASQELRTAVTSAVTTVIGGTLLNHAEENPEKSEPNVTLIGGPGSEGKFPFSLPDLAHDMMATVTQASSEYSVDRSDVEPVRHDEINKDNLHGRTSQPLDFQGTSAAIQSSERCNVSVSSEPRSEVGRNSKGKRVDQRRSVRSNAPILQNSTIGLTPSLGTNVMLSTQIDSLWEQYMGRSTTPEPSPPVAQQLIKVFLEPVSDQAVAQSAAQNLLYSSMPRENVDKLHITMLNDRWSRHSFLGLRLTGGSKPTVEHLRLGWHLAKSAEDADAIQKEGIRCDKHNCNSGLYGRGGYISTSAAIANSYADQKESTGRRYLFLVLAFPDEDVIQGRHNVRHESTSVDNPSLPTQYCFVDKARLHCVCRLDFEWVPTGDMGGVQEVANLSNSRNFWFSSSRSLRDLASPRAIGSLRRRLAERDESPTTYQQVLQKRQAAQEHMRRKALGLPSLRS